jgi:hypothetical protein
METRLPIPKNWQDFEQLCHALWKEIWGDPNAQRNGRAGQAQAGVDIFGQPMYLHRLSGVQCKDKDSRLGSSLSASELVAECKKAANFVPAIGDFTMATTAPRDESIQQEARMLTAKRQFPFDVYVWSWDDIEQEIRPRPKLLDAYFPGLQYSSLGSPQLYTSVISHRDQCLAFFSRPEMLHRIPFGLREVLLPLCYELIDNAYRHGKASRFTITCNDAVVSLEDDGIAFDPISDLDASKVNKLDHIGSYVFDAFRAKFRDEVELEYARDPSSESGLNRLSILFKSPTRSFSASPSEVNIDLNVAIGRAGAERYAESIPLPPNGKDLILNVTHYANISALVMFIHSMLGRLRTDSRLVVYLPQDWLLEPIPTWIKDSRLIFRFR